MNTSNENLQIRDGMSALEFHLSLINRAHNTLHNDELRDAVLWLLPEIIGDDLIWWHISPVDDEIYLVSIASPWNFSIVFYPENGFIKIQIECSNKDNPEHNIDEIIAFIDFDKNPKEYPAIASLVEKYRQCSLWVDMLAPTSRESQIRNWIGQ